MCTQSSFPRWVITLATILVACLPRSCEARRAPGQGGGLKLQLLSSRKAGKAGTATSKLQLLSGKKAGTATVSMVSASYGGRGHRKELPRCPQGMSCVLYTDTPVDAANGWIVDQTPYHISMNESHKDLFTSGRHSYGHISQKMVKKNMEAKFYKMNTYLLPQAAGVDIIFWCDADSIGQACKDPHLADSIRNSLSGRAMTVKAHEVRTTVRTEIPEADYMCRARGYQNGMQDMNDAMAHMEEMGFKDDAGLFHCDQFILDARSPVVHNLMRAWWHEVQDYTFRDQISFPFVLQRFRPPVRVVARKENILHMPPLERTA